MSIRPSKQAATRQEQATNNNTAPITQSQPQYVYQQQAPSLVETVISTILHPGVNPQTFSVLNVTLVVLFICISLMLFAFDGIASRFRLHLWIFLATCVSLLLAVNWFFIRYQSYGGDSDDEEEEDERPKRKKVAAKKAPARKGKKAQVEESEEEDEEEEEPITNQDHEE